MIITCHQPNFIPWVPFFEKVSRADMLIALTHVQFSKNNFQNRFQLNGQWHTMSVNKGNLSDLIRDKKYVKPFEDWTKIKKKINMSWLDCFDRYVSNDLANTNLNIIKGLLDILDIKTSVITDEPTCLKSPSDKLLHLCLKHNASTYISGPSGIKYLEVDKFKKSGIKVIFMEKPINTDSIITKVSHEFN